MLIRHKDGYEMDASLALTAFTALCASWHGENQLTNLALTLNESALTPLGRITTGPKRVSEIEPTLPP